MQPIEYAPHAVVRPFVKCLWLAERDFAPPHATFELLPDRYVELIFSFGAPLLIEGAGGARELPRAYLLGLHHAPLRLRGSGVVCTVAARCWAWGHAALLHTAPGADLIQPLHATLDQWHGQLAPLVAQRDWHGALECLHAALLERALHTQWTPDALHRAAALLHTRRGAASIGGIANECATSPRHLEWQVRHALGLTPKLLARQMRFERVRDHLWHAPHTALADLALEYGYADQTHLTREFRHFS